MNGVSESSGGVPSRAQSSTDQTGQVARQRFVWGSLLRPNTDQIDQNIHPNEDEIDQLDQDDQDDHDDQSDQGEIADDEESVAFDSVFEPTQVLWLQSFDLTNDQLKAIEGHPKLGVNAALSMISLAVEKAEDLDKLKALSNENRALRSLIRVVADTDFYVSAFLHFCVSARKRINTKRMLFFLFVEMHFAVARF